MSILSKLIILLSIALTFICFSANSQALSFTRYDIQDGLAASTVYGATQDQDGFLWFATESGLSRFDGSQFRNYTIRDGLPGNDILGVYTDTKNRVWLLPFKYAIGYYEKGVFHNNQNDPELKKIKLRNQIAFIAEDSKGNIMIADLTGDCYTFSISGKVNFIGRKNDVRIKLSTPLTGLGQIPSSLLDLPNLVKEHPLNIDLSLPAHREISPGSQDIWLPAKARNQMTDSAFISKKQNNALKSVKLPQKSQFVLPINNYEYALLGADSGILIYNTLYPAQSNVFLEKYRVLYVYEDAEKNLWFCTKGTGVFKVKATHFKNYALNDRSVQDIQKIDGKIYVGVDDNNYWKLDALNQKSFENNNIPVATMANLNLDLILAQSKSLYLNCAGFDFLNFKSYRKGGFNRYASLKTLYAYSDTLLIATSSGSYLIDHKTLRLIRTVYNGRSTCAYSFNGRIYIGTTNGLLEAAYNLPPRSLGNDHPLLNAQISQITGSPQGILWIATYESGVIGYKDGRIIATISMKEGLASDICRCIRADKDCLWVGTNKGLDKIAVSHGKYYVDQHFSEADGLISNIVNAIYRDKHIVYIGTALGMTVLRERGNNKHGLSKVNITAVIAGEKGVNPLLERTVLKRPDNNIRIEYSGISFLSEGNITYQYRLRGLDDRWQVTKEQALTYPSLPSGSYSFEIRSINKFGDKSPVAKFSFEVKRLLWEEWWMRLAELLAIIVLTGVTVWFYIRARNNKARKKMVTAQKMMELEQMALRAQMNPHFIFNCLNSMQRHIIGGDVRKANFYLTCFAGLVRQTLDHSSKAYILLSEEIEYLTNYIQLEKLQLAESFTYEIATDPALNGKAVQIPNMVLQPYIENAVKHGISTVAEGGFIKIAFSLDDTGSCLTCVIEDNGWGIERTKEKNLGSKHYHDSKGMSITDKRIETLNNLRTDGRKIVLDVIDLKNSSDFNRGTRVIVSFPI